MLDDSRGFGPVLVESPVPHKASENLCSRYTKATGWSQAKESFVARNREDCFRLGKISDAQRKTDHACGDTGRRAGDAVLAAKPDAHAEATAQHRWQGNYAGADRRAASPVDSCGAH